MTLDIRTIYMMNAVIYLMLHGIIWVSLSRYRNQLVRQWSLGGIISAAGVVFLGSEGQVPDWVVAVFGQVLMSLGNFGRQYAMRAIAGAPSTRWIWGMALFNLAYLGLNGTLFFSGASRAVMMEVFFGFYAIVCFDYVLAGRAIRRWSNSAGTRSVQWSGWVFSITLAIKCVSVWMGWGAQDLYDSGWDQAVMFGGQFLAISLLNFGFMQILVDQFQQERMQTEFSLAVQRDRTVLAEQHSRDLSQLLNEREEIMRHLTLSNKTAGMGALVSNMAHEINQPLATVVLKSELVETWIGQPDSDEHIRQLCRKIREDAHRAGDMIRTLRGMFSLGRGQFERLDFAALLRDVLDIIRSQAERKGIAIEVDVPRQAWLTGDATQLQQVVLNLLNNAIQAVGTVASPRIVLHCRVEDTSVVLRVQDNGVGIAPELRADVFALVKSKAARDMGVGLWLSQAVVQSHGGTIDFESQPGQGSVFQLRLSGKHTTSMY